MRILYTLCLIIVCASIKAQTLKTYSGTYKGGNARYTYYEDNDGGRIYHGSFIFTSSKKKQYSTNSNEAFSDTITGKFENGKPVGNWYYKHKQTYIVLGYKSTEYWKRQTSYIDGLNHYKVIENGFVKESNKGKNDTQKRFISFAVRDGKLDGECILKGYGHNIVCQATKGRISSYIMEKFQGKNLVSKEVSYTDSIRYVIDNETGSKTILPNNEKPIISLITLLKYNYFQSMNCCCPIANPHADQAVINIPGVCSHDYHY